MRTLRRAPVVALLAVSVLLINSLMAQGAEPPGQRGGLPQSSSIYCIRPPDIFYHNVGLLELLVTNIGVIGNPYFTDGYGAGWRGGEYLYAASLWVGAIASDNLAYVTTGAYDYEFRPSLSAVDTIYPAYEGIQGGNRPGFSANFGDDDRDGAVDEDPHNGKDDDKDGLIDEDYSAISQQMFSCEYWDYTEEAISGYPEHRPLNIRVRQNSFAWSTEGSNEFVGFDFKIYNDGLEVLRTLYVGFFVDSDAGPKDKPGYYADDRGAFYSRDTLVVDPTNSFECEQTTEGHRKCNEQKLHLDICYMYDVPDDGATATGGDVPGYFGGMFLGHTTDPFGVMAPMKVMIHTAQFFSGSGAYPAGDPRNDFERYDLLSRGTKLTRPTGQPADYRYLFSAGPFKELAPGDRLELQTAFVIGDGLEGGGSMLDNAVNAQRIYNGAWRDVDGDKETGRYTGRGGKETCLFILPDQPPLIWRDPCDSLNPTSVVIKDTVCKLQNWKDNDCDCCTPLYRSNKEAEANGYETLVHWVGTVAPPPPGTNIDIQTDPAIKVAAPGGDRRVVLQWDNLSELSADPIQQKILFTGYRVWRVEGWRRPIGSTGPAPEDWQLIADLSLRPPDSLKSESPYYLPNYQRDPPDGPECLYKVQTGSSDSLEMVKCYYPPGRYQFDDTLGLKNGMIYFYDVTAYSAWDDSVRHFELSGRPSASETDKVVPQWPVEKDGSEVIVVPNPYIRGAQPGGWDLSPSDADPTGTKIAFANLPAGEVTVRIYTLAGDIIQTLTTTTCESNGTVFWNLITRNGQDVVSGVYLYSVECTKRCSGDSKPCGSRKIGRFTIIR